MSCELYQEAGSARVVVVYEFRPAALFWAEMAFLRSLTTKAKTAAKAATADRLLLSKERDVVGVMVEDGSKGRWRCLVLDE